MKMYLVKQKKDDTYVDFNVYLIKSQAQKAIDNLHDNDIDAIVEEVKVEWNKHKWIY